MVVSVDVPDVEIVVVCEVVTDVVTVLVKLEVPDVVADVVPVVESHRRNEVAHSVVFAKNAVHCPASFIQGPAVKEAQPSHKAKSSGSKHRRYPNGQVCVVSFSNPSHRPIAS